MSTRWIAPLSGSASNAAILEAFPFSDVSGGAIGLGEVDNVANPGATAGQEETGAMTESDRGQSAGCVSRARKRTTSFGRNYLDIADIASGTSVACGRNGGLEFLLQSLVHRTSTPGK